MKLFSAYKNIVGEIKPTLLWFTTFNLNIELVERFLLPCLVGKEPAELRTAEDYEALNLELVNYNIKVWYDFKAISFQNDKRTTIDIEAVDAGKILKNQAEDLIFHPKVIFLKGEKAAYLIVGSANLSVAAWHSNRECFLVKEVTSKRNALEITQFYQSINPSQKGIKDLQRWANTLKDVYTDWNFRHNFNMQFNLLEELHAKKITVWSPYFSKEISKLINAFRQSGIKDITLVPDIDQSGKVRIIPKELEMLKNDTSIAICKDAAKQEAQGLFHAKVWLTEKNIAIGSWNCSFRATGISTIFNQRNIEAGIIENIQSKESKSLLNNLTPVPHTSISGISEEELDAEWEKDLQNYSMTCQIIADWETFTYDLVEQEFEAKYWVSLPDMPNEKVALLSIKDRSFIKHHLNVLKNKSFTVYNADGKIVYAGYIEEQGKANRPATSYVSLLDLFESLIIDPLGETTRKRVRYSMDEEDSEADNDGIPFFCYNGHESTYMMFVSFQRLQDSIHANSTDQDKIKALGFRLPGSIINIITLVEESVNKSLSEGKEDDLLFHYFLCIEVNECIDLFNLYSPQKISTIYMDKLIIKLNLSKQDNRFLKMAN